MTRRLTMFCLRCGAHAPEGALVSWRCPCLHARLDTDAEKARLLDALTRRQLRDGVPAVAVRAMQDRATKADLREGECPSFDEVA